jgi:hypothetical protein
MKSKDRNRNINLKTINKMRNLLNIERQMLESDSNFNDVFTELNIASTASMLIMLTS